MKNDPLGNVIAVVNAKGGVGKTSVSSNLAGRFAHEGHRVLAVDCDASANLQLNLGYSGDPANDQGKSLVTAVWQGSVPVPLRNAGGRENLDALPGGKELKLLELMNNSSDHSQSLEGGSVPAAFAAALARIAGEYDYVFLDCPPYVGSALQDMALGAARYLVIPVEADPASWESLTKLGPRVKAARENGNPQITYLGAVLFGFKTNATAVMRETRESLAGINKTVPLFDHFVRESSAVGLRCRMSGQLAHELAEQLRADQASSTISQRIKAARIRKEAGEPTPKAIPEAAIGISDDYDQLHKEVRDRIKAHRKSTVNLTGRGARVKAAGGAR